MAKILKDTELADIVQRVTNVPGLLDDSGQYAQFLEDLADLLTKHFGGERRNPAGAPDDELGWTVGIHLDDNVPSDGGIWSDYDTDVVWKDGMEGVMSAAGQFQPLAAPSQAVPGKYVIYGPVPKAVLDEIEMRVNFHMTGDRCCFCTTESLAEALKDNQVKSRGARILVEHALEAAEEQDAHGVEFYC